MASPMNETETFRMLSTQQRERTPNYGGFCAKVLSIDSGVAMAQLERFTLKNSLPKLQNLKSFKIKKTMQRMTERCDVGWRMVGVKGWEITR